MVKNIGIVMIALVFLLSACAPPASDEPTQTPTATQTTEPDGIPGTSNGDEGSNPSPLEPLPNEENMVRGNVFIDNLELLILESFPIQAALQIQGSLPTPCHNLRADVDWSESESRVDVDLYSLADSDAICVQVLEPFDTNISLGSFPEGEYTVWVNGEQVGEFTAP